MKTKSYMVAAIDDTGASLPALTSSMKIVDGASVLYLIGSTMDWVEDDFTAGFVVHSGGLIQRIEPAVPFNWVPLPIASASTSIGPDPSLAWDVKGVATAGRAVEAKREPPCRVPARTARL